MPNIILTEYCNLQCPYCFADPMIEEAKQEKNKNITLDQLDKIFNWLLPSAISKDFRVGLIGGEPTLHPQFSDILTKTNAFCSNTKSSAIVFTNGILLKQFIPLFGQNMAALINVNRLKENLNNQLIESLDETNKLNWFKERKITLGCNLYLYENDYSFFWNIVDRYKDIQIVRMSVTAPIEKIYKENKELYYNQMKETFLDFLNEAKKRNIEISFDCNQIPLCFFTEEEQKFILSMGYKKNNFCDPVIDITPNFKATCCFGVYNPVDCSRFKDLENLTKYFQTSIVLKTLHNNNSLCKDCEQLELMQCQGGCLSFSSLASNF